MKPALIIFGNCQAQGLLGAIAGLPSCMERFEVSYIPSHASLGDTNFNPEMLQRCEVLWEQVGMEQRLPGWEAVPAGVRHIRFAELSFPVLWPFNCIDPRNRHDPPNFPWGAWPYGDRVALQIAKEGLKGVDAVTAYVERGAKLMPDLARMLDMEVVRSRKRDANVDLSMTSYIQDNFRTKRLFATYNHARNALVWELFQRLMEATVLTDMKIPASELDACERSFVDPNLKWPNFDTIQMPVHPTLAEQYQLSWINDSTRYRHYDAGSFSFHDFIMHYVEYAESAQVAPVQTGHPKAGLNDTDLIMPASITCAPMLVKQEEFSNKVAETAGRFNEEKSSAKALARENLSYARLTGNPPAPLQPPITTPFTSRVCRQADLSMDSFRYWCAKMRHAPMMHRKYWEWFFITQSLWERDFLKEGSRGVGFNNGNEPLVALFASLGCKIVSADLNGRETSDTAMTQEADLRTLNEHGICPPDLLSERVLSQTIDPDRGLQELSGPFDFYWSSTCLGHMGSIEAGIDFMRRAMSVLKPGGMAIFTTDCNLSAGEDTLENDTLCLFRQSDLERLATRLSAEGHMVTSIDWRDTTGSADAFIDQPPYGMDPHLKLQIMQYVVTSFGLSVIKRAF
jgi:hypothetical protein